MRACMCAETFPCRSHPWVDLLGCLLLWRMPSGARHAAIAAAACGAEINTAFDLLHSGQCLRCVLTFDK